MKIRNAKNSDVTNILEFCKNTFSWGDYIDSVWKYWIKEGNLFVLEDKIPVGICHAFFSKNQVWIEGIRINPLFRRRHFASKLISHVENIAIKKNIVSSYMLIDSENTSSLYMAQKLEYAIMETWNFYSINPEPNVAKNIKFGSNFKKIPFSHYIKSWRWLPIDDNTLQSLENNKKIIFCDTNGGASFAIITESEHFEKTLIITFHGGSKQNNVSLLSFLQNFGYENNFERIQILSKDLLPSFKNLEKKLSFNLMRKLLD